MSKVYIILVNYKKYSDTVECLESIFKNYYNNFQVLIVDNSPDLSSLTNLSKWLNNQYGQIPTLFEDLVYPLNNKLIPHATLMEAELQNSARAYQEQVLLIRAENRGFAAANNIALNYILKTGEKDDFIWILNNDTVIDKYSLTNLLNFYSNGDSYDKLIGAKLMHYHDRNTLQAIAATYNKWLGITKHIGDGETDVGQYDKYEVKKTDYIVGACMFLPFEYLQKVGVLNEQYFLFYEELDWLLSAAKLNLGYAVQPKAIIYHKEGSTIRGAKESKNMDVADYYINVNRIRFTLKWYPSYILSVCTGLSYSLLKRLIQGRFKLVLSILKGTLSLIFKRRIINNK
ncbi:glycosyltransferase family 2 protein [Mucilaginibacter sp. JRF]|uniref:glycosyltransferase family 2 protein n=1 Tax=Mucilaginibacter sp. JRF TaxID=2780088 RepID=UPI001880BAF6|nr:glycosyltransferase family 2 protein [Mucilaginibacter sp. JRF]MBE9585156.1 glycosyltransferase family 2 protein [Mucilaginibacter sp. JRF]